MKLFYLTALDDLDQEKCGILGKINGQIDALEKSGIRVFLGHFHGRNLFVVERESLSLIASGKTLRNRLGSIYPVLLDYILENQIENVYIRFTSLDNKAILFYKELKKNNIRVVIEFYSHNLELEARNTAIRNLRKKKYLQGLRGLLSLYINKYYFKKLHKYVDLIVTTTEVNELYGVPTINVRNGIDVNSYKVREKKHNEYDFNIIAVAMISPWHGYDRVIIGLHDYYVNGGNKNILLSIIGDGEERKNLELLTKKYGLEDHVVFTGIKLKDDLNPYYDMADIAIEMLAGFRRTKGEVSTIKIAEYFSKGVPVVYASDVDYYDGKLKDYCYKVINDDSPVNIQDLIEFCEDLDRKHDNIENEMHEMAIQYFDWRITMSGLISYLLDE